MSLNRIILEALAKNPVGLKEALSEVLAERVSIAIEEAIETHDLKRIHKDYQGYKAMSTSDVLRHHKGLRKISGNYTAQDAGGKDALISGILRDKHGHKKVDAYFDLKSGEKKALDEGAGMKYRPFHRDEWKAQAASMGLTVKPAVDIEGNSGNLMLAKDKYGNTKGSFHAKTGGHLEEAVLDELSKKTLVSYIKKSTADRDENDAISARESIKNRKPNGESWSKEMNDADRRAAKRDDGINAANRRLKSRQYSKVKVHEDLEEATKGERSQMAFVEKQAVRAAEKANVGAMSRAEKEAWVDDYLEKNHIPKGALGSAVYSGVIKVRALAESDDDANYIVRAKSPFYNRYHYIDTHTTPSAKLIKSHEKHATPMSHDQATKLAKELKSHPNKYETEIIKKDLKESTDDLTEISDGLKRRWLDKSVQKASDNWHKTVDNESPEWKAKYMTAKGNVKKSWWESPELKQSQQKDRVLRAAIQKTSKAVTGKPHYHDDGEKEINADKWWKGEKYVKEDTPIVHRGNDEANAHFNKQSSDMQQKIAKHVKAGNDYWPAVRKAHNDTSPTDTLLPKKPKISVFGKKTGL